MNSLKNINNISNKSKYLITITIFFGIIFVFFLMYQYISYQDKQTPIKIKVKDNQVTSKSEDEDLNTKTNTTDQYMMSGRTADIFTFCEEIDCKLNKTRDKCIYTEDGFTFGCPPECIEFETKCKNIQ